MYNPSKGTTPAVDPKNIKIGSPSPKHSPAIVTVVRDPNHHLGKRFDLNPDGTVNKESAVHLSFGIAVQHDVQTPESFVELLNKVSEDPSAAIINASFDGIPVGEEFAILSEREIENRLGIPCTDREKQKGVHAIEYDGKPMKAVGRFKENIRPSPWQLLDRDIDEQTPPEFANMSDEEWLSALAKILPGIDQVTTVSTRSTSSRVICDGKPVGGGNGHFWFMLNKADDAERIRAAIIVLAAQAEMTWPKSRFSRSEAGQRVGQSLATIIDPSVLTAGRLVFIGKPVVSDGLTVEALKPIIHRRECDAFNTAAVVMPDADKVREITRKAGVEMSVTTGHSGLRVSANDLTLGTELETQRGGVLSVRQLVERGTTGKIRCQSPFRASESWAAFYNTNADGIPFVHDVGTATTHWLNEFEVEDVKIIPALDVVKQLLPKVKEDAAAVLEDEAVNALATIKQNNSAAFQRARNALKQANKDVSLASVDRSVKARIDETDTVETHHGYAKSILAELTEEAWQPVGYQGDLYVVNATSGLWERQPFEALIRMVTKRHDAKEHCSRASDYRAISDHAISLASNDAFFVDVPNGLACPGGFYQIVGNDITLVPLTPDHRQRVMLGFTPEKTPTPRFDNFLHETFQSLHDGEEAQQVTLLQEIVGGIMLGVLYKYQIAILFYEPFGRAGKGTTEKQIRSLVPKEFVSAISPFKWNQDYHVATLAGKRLNVVGELSESEPIPASAFKTVIGGDLVTGRHPTHRPITFSNEAAHLFMSNHFITTKDQSEAFFARWKIVEFPNSRLRSGLPLDENLAQRIIENELPGIAYWALEGATRLLRNGKLSASSAHDRLMAKWRRSTNTLEEFIHDSCELAAEAAYRRSDLYRDYTDWCSDNGRKPFSKGRVKELLEHNIGMGIRLIELSGHETFRGIKEKPPKKSAAETPGTQTRRRPEPVRKKATKWVAVRPKLQASVPPSALSGDDITAIPDTPEAAF